MFAIFEVCSPIFHSYAYYIFIRFVYSTCIVCFKKQLYRSVFVCLHVWAWVFVNISSQSLSSVTKRDPFCGFIIFIQACIWIILKSMNLLRFSLFPGRIHIISTSSFGFALDCSILIRSTRLFLSFYFYFYFLLLLLHIPLPLFILILLPSTIPNSRLQSKRIK